MKHILPKNSPNFFLCFPKGDIFRKTLSGFRFSKIESKWEVRCPDEETPKR